ncbi:MAG: GNAT family N-acetyltransferase [Chloroflexota bacterium]|nr:GNAT family N-acetyltransferase [Chloroflexota bacterium]
MSNTVAAPSGYAIERIDPAAASTEVEAQVVALMQAIEREESPDDPPPPYEAMAAQFRMSSPFREMHWSGAFHAGRVVGGAMMMIDKTGANTNVRQVYLQVLPEHRRRGIARALLASVLAEIGDESGVVIHTWTTTRMPAGIACAERFGGEPALRMRTNQLDVASVDRGLMEEWARRDPPGYRLEWIDDDVPDRLMDNVITAIQTMNTSPREGLQVEDFVVTPEIVRDRERQRRERGSDHWMLLAVDEATGQTAAFTEINIDRRTPTVLWQGGTATIPEHRGKKLGKWVKGRMMLRILDELPAVRSVRTNNAGSNAPMLAINEQMGYRFAYDNFVYQMTLEKARERVRR